MLDRTLTLWMALPSAALMLDGCKGCNAEPGKPTTPAEFTDDWGQWASLALTPAGQPAVLSYDATVGGALYSVGTVGTDGVTWRHEAVDGFIVDGMDGGDRGRYASLAIATDGTAWAAYYDNLIHVLRYAERRPDGPGAVSPLAAYGDPIPLTVTPTSWTTNVADPGSGSTPDTGRFASIALDIDQNPVIAHHDQANGELRVCHWNSTAFECETVDQGTDYDSPDTGVDTKSADVGEYAALSIDGTFELIAYYDAAWGSLRVASGTPGSYHIEVVDDEGDVGAWPEIVRTSDGDYVILYQDVGAGGLKAATGRPGEWTTSTWDASEHVGADSAAWVHDDGRIDVVYDDGRNNNLKRAVRDSSGTPTVTTLAGDDAAVGFHNEIVELDGVTYAGTYDYTHHRYDFSALP